MNIISQNEIQKIARDIAEAVNAERVVLFGSYANGHAGEDSDIDLLVVAESDQPRYRRSRDLYRLFHPHGFALDIVVYTPEEMNQNSRTPVSFVSQVMREGKTVYVRRT